MKITQQTISVLEELGIFANSKNERDVRLGAFFKVYDLHNGIMLTYLIGQGRQPEEAETIIRDYGLYLFQNAIRNIEKWLPSMLRNFEGFIMEGVDRKFGINFPMGS